MMKKIIHLNKFRGVNNVLSPRGMATLSGPSFLKKADNVVVSDSGSLVSPGRLSNYLLLGSVTSLFSHDGLLYGLHNGNIFVYDGVEFATLGPVSRERVHFCGGPGGIVFFTGDEHIGQILNFSVTYPTGEVTESFETTDFVLSGKEFVRESSDRAEVTKYPLETGERCAFFHSRVFVSNSNIITFSDPFNFLYTSEDNFVSVDAPVTALLGSETFLFVGTTTGAFVIIDLEGSFSIKPIVDGPVVPDSCISLPQQFMGSRLEADSIIFTTDDGVFVFSERKLSKLSPQYRTNKVTRFIGSGVLSADGSNFYCLEEE